MIKTPEEMAEEYASKIYQLKYYVDGRRKHSQGQEGLRWLAGKNGFLAGYKAAQDTYKDAISTYEKVAKQLLEEAVRIMSPKDQLADADKVIDTCEHILDMEKMVDVNSSSEWISVKDRLPKEEEIVLTVCDNGKMFLLQKVSDEMFGVPIYWKYCCGFDKELEPNESYCYDVTHWQPLPAPPKEEK